MREEKRLEFILEADLPIAHHSETFGNTAVLMREKRRQPDGRFAAIPLITGDTMRHGLRESAAWAYLSAAGLLGGHLTEAALRLLFAGGMVTGSSGTIDLGEYRELCDIFPPIGLLGGCAGNRVNPGRMEVDSAELICRETEHRLPAWVLEWSPNGGCPLGEALHPARAHIEEVQRVRMDPTLDPSKRHLLTGGERARVEGRLASSGAAQGDAVAAERSKSSLMPRRFERICAGSHFYWSVSATCYSELDIDTFMTMCGAFLSGARVGGKKATGHGRIVPRAARHVLLAPLEDRVESISLVGSDARVGELFRRHVAERSERIREWLAGVVA